MFLVDWLVGLFWGFLYFVFVFQTITFMRYQMMLQSIHQTFEGPITENILHDS